MDISPNLPVAGVAGTARSQAKGTDADRPALSAGVAENQNLSNNDVHEGTRSEDKDADGRQVLDQFSQQQEDEQASQDNEQRDETKPRQPNHPPSTDPHLGRRLDFDA